MIMYPFANIILWSLILALALHPLHQYLIRKLGGKPKLAAMIIVVSFLILIILPASLLTASLFEEVKTLRAHYNNGTLTIPPPTDNVKDWPLIGEKLYDTWRTSSDNLAQTIETYRDDLLNVGKKIASGILSIAGSLVKFVIALIMAAILLNVTRAGEEIRKLIRKLAGERGDEFADIARQTVGNVVKGILGVALILALLHGIVLMLSGVPYPGIWTLVILVLSVLQIPLFIVTVPIIIYLFAHNSSTVAIMWTVIFLLVGLSDNVLKPILLGKGAAVPMMVIFIGVIGGFILSGFIGLFTGAIVLSLGYKLLVGWMNEGNLASPGNNT
jgi:predicted PurR-regulated permease PerM